MILENLTVILTVLAVVGFGAGFLWVIRKNDKAIEAMAGCIVWIVVGLPLTVVAIALGVLAAVVTPFVMLMVLCSDLYEMRRLRRKG